MKGNKKMLKVIVNLPNTKNIFPFNSEFGALYFATSLREYAELHHEYLPSIDVVDDETGEVMYQSPEIRPCEWLNLSDLERTILSEDSPCKNCHNRDCGLYGLAHPW